MQRNSRSTWRRLQHGDVLLYGFIAIFLLLAIPRVSPSLIVFIGLAASWSAIIAILLFLRIRFAKIAVMLFWIIISAYGVGRIFLAGFTWQRGFIALCGPIMIAVYRHYGIGPRDDEEREWREHMGRSLALARDEELTANPDYSFLPNRFQFAIPFFENWSIDDDVELNEAMSDISQSDEAELREWAARLSACGQAGELYDLSLGPGHESDALMRGRWNVSRALLALDAIGITLTD